MTEAFLCDAIRTPIGRYAGSLSSVRADDLGAVPLKALMERNPNVDWTAVALSCGYFDQAHFIHDFREFAGVTPSMYLRFRASRNHVVVHD